MIAKLIPIILALVFAGPLSAQVADGFAAGPSRGFEYGPRPPLSVFDPNGFLMPELVEEISAPLAEYYKKEGIDVIVVVLADLGNAPPEHVARTFAAAWCTSPIHCVVLHVPGREGSPWIVPNGKLVEYLIPDQVQKAINNGQRRAASEAKDADKVKAAATEAADMLRYWMANAINRSEMIQSESTKMRAELETHSRQWKITAMVAVVAVILLIAGIAFLVASLRKRGPRYFPKPAATRRLGAPYSGGNHAVVELGSPAP